MKYFKWFFLLINAFILSCSMHFDEFDKSNYLSLSSLNFENQKGSTQIYEEEHLIKVSFPEADSTEDYDYIVIDSLEMRDRKSVV